MGAFKLGKMTFGSLFKQPETVKYPFETKPQPMGLKGHIQIDVESCILCGMCDRSCATGCITVDKAARTWAIDRLQCVQCGYCITVCPKKCLEMNPNYAPATTEHKADSFTVPEQGKPAAKKEATASESAQAAAPEADVKAAAPKAEQPQGAVQATDVPKDIQQDAQLETLLALMDPDKAAKVRAAL